MEGYDAGRSQDRGSDGSVFGVEFRYHFIRLRFSHAHEFKHPGVVDVIAQGSDFFCEHFVEHGAHLPGRSRQQQHFARVHVDVLARRRADTILQDFRPFDDKRLPGVDFRHGDATFFEDKADFIDDFFLENQLFLQGVGGGFAGEVVLCGTQAAGDDHQLGSFAGGFYRPGQILDRVAHHHFHVHQDALFVKLSRHV